jgi:hypothetical protein
MILFAAGSFAAVAARADLPSPLRIHREVHEHVHDVLSHLVRIPDRIHREHERHLQVFFGGREYYRPHRHEHSIYRFPVWIGDVVEYRPYTYCGDEIFGGPPVRPRVWVEWGSASYGSWCNHHHGYYPRAHSCFRPHRDRYIDRRHDYRDHRRYNYPYDHSRDRRYDGRRHDRYERHDRYDRRDRDDRGDRWDRRRDDRRHDRDRDHRSRGRGRGHGRH